MSEMANFRLTIPKISGITSLLRKIPVDQLPGSERQPPTFFPENNYSMTTLNLENLLTEDDKSFIPYLSRRSVVHSTKGIIASTQPLANEAGYQILAKGGNAADAAVAVAAALNVTGTCTSIT
jgi:hypothetical protein